MLHFVALQLKELHVIFVNFSVVQCEAIRFVTVAFFNDLTISYWPIKTSSCCTVETL